MSILVLSGSIRRESFHARLALLALNELRQQGATAELLNPAEYPLPLYDGDLEQQALPDNARRLRRQFATATALVIASPEYNGSVTPLLKNLLDWSSRQDPANPELEPFAGKAALLLSTSPGSLAGQRGLRHTREILTSLNLLVLPQQVSVPGSFQAFDADGQLVDAKHRQALQTQIRQLLHLSQRLAA